MCKNLEARVDIEVHARSGHDFGLELRSRKLFWALRDVDKVIGLTTIPDHDERVLGINLVQVEVSRELLLRILPRMYNDIPIPRTEYLF